MWSSDGIFKLSRSKSAGALLQSTKERPQLHTVSCKLYYSRIISNSLSIWNYYFPGGKPFYGDAAIKSDEAVKAHRDLIYTKIARVSIFNFIWSFNLCNLQLFKNIFPTDKAKGDVWGNNFFKASRIDSGKINPKSDETWLILCTCPHDMVPLTCTTKKHSRIPISFTTWARYRIASYFCNDVACKYWKFAIRVRQGFPQNMPMVNEMNGFLPRMHA